MTFHESEELKKKVWELIKDIRVALFATHNSRGALHSRPMVAKQENFEGGLWFYAHDKSRKVKEILQNPDVLLNYSSPEKQIYVSLSGHAEIIRDRTKIREFWSEFLRTWFPKGADDPDLLLIKVEPQWAEYWDAPSKAVTYAYGYLKARLTGEIPKIGEHNEVLFRHSN